MFVRFFKGQPNDFVIKYVSGKIAGQGKGLSFAYVAFRTSIVVVPTSSSDASFVFHDMTSNFQQVTIQGQLTFRVVNPATTATVLNFAIDPNTRKYVSTDPDRLVQRITNVAQAKIHDQILSKSLEESIRDSERIANAAFESIREHPTLTELGVEVLTMHIESIRPTPEVAKALEADYRETLLRKADEAIYSRRASAVEEERKIKEKELASNVALEEGKRAFIELQGKNALLEATNKAEASIKEAQAKGEALAIELGAYKDMDPRLLAAYGFARLASKGAEKLTITSEVLAALMDATSS